MTPFDKQCSDLAPRIIKATMAVFMQMANSPQFMPTAQKFHYQFNLRDFAKIIQNMLQSVPSIYKGNPKGLARMWAHECHRVWQDRLIKPEDHVSYLNFMKLGCKEFGDIKEDDILEEPNIYTSFVAQCEGHDATYMEIKGLEHLKEVLESKLEEYNEQVQSMNLVLFTMPWLTSVRLPELLVYLAVTPFLLVSVVPVSNLLPNSHLSSLPTML
jgi:dynein heavy chain